MIFRVLILLVLAAFTTACQNRMPVHSMKKYLAKEMDLRITTEQKKISLSNRAFPQVKVSLNNFTRETVKILQPGDGSKVGWRTPTIRWSVIDLATEDVHPDTLPDLKQRIARCGNMNGLNMNSIVTLKPKNGIKLQWVSEPPIPRKPGKYSVKFYYQHDPNDAWVLRGYLQNEGKRIIKEETRPMFLVSNELVFELTE